jgi:FMN phosphatase YigB (HAD superfamily)
MPPILVLDFDGTLTDAEREGPPFVEGYLKNLDTLIGAPASDTSAVADELRARVRQLAADAAQAAIDAPATHGYLWKGKLVAPASVDPYLRMVPMAHAVLDAFQAILDPIDRMRVMDLLFYPNYQLTIDHPVFRPEARALITALAPHQDRVYVVTNSGTTHVQKKIAQLAAGDPAVAWLGAHVRGNAQKFEVDEAWHVPGVPPQLTIPGLARPVLTQRRFYYERLAAVVAAHGATFADLIVVGDIFELDLALPLSLGARVGLRKNPLTPAYELEFLQGQRDKARVFDDLAALPAWAFGDGA